MKKKIILRGLFGLPVGIAIGFVITLLISICIGDGSFYPVTPELIQTTGNELNAVILQTILCAILGVGFAMASVIWEIDSWSIAKQSGVYFLIISVVILSISFGSSTVTCSSRNPASTSDGSTESFFIISLILFVTLSVTMTIFGSVQLSSILISIFNPISSFPLLHYKGLGKEIPPFPDRWLLLSHRW